VIDDDTLAEGGRSRLRWRCRRGMRELDLLLLRWLDRVGAGATPEQLALFDRLLDVEDDQLWRWCMGRERPEDKELDELVERILALPA
jgi:antitoxin CptB